LATVRELGSGHYIKKNTDDDVLRSKIFWNIWFYKAMDSSKRQQNF
jgi:hypothetical protein